MDGISSGGISSQVATVDYLQLLTVQLQNQDPIDPVDQEGLINDLTQFSMLEGVENLNSTFAEMLKLQELSQGVSFIGKEVEYQDPASGEIKSGTVSDIFNQGDAINLLIGGDSVELGNVLRVSAGADEGTADP